MVSKRKHMFQILLCIIMIVVLMAFHIFNNYKSTLMVDQTINQITKPIAPFIMHFEPQTIQYLNASKNESFFDESILLNNKIKWTFDQPTIIIIGGHCSATTSMCSAINRFNYFVHSGCDQKYFTDCTPNIQTESVDTIRNQKYNMVNKMLQPSAKHQNASFQINLNWAIIPWNVSISFDNSKSETCNWNRYLQKLHFLPKEIQIK
eukprot:3493_1